MERAYKYRIYPNARQRALIQETFDACRFVWNDALAWRKAAWELSGRSPSASEQDRCLPALKRACSWLSEVDSHALQQTLRDLDRAFKAFFRRCREGGKPGYPRFRSKRRPHASYRTNVGFAVVDARHVKALKLGMVRCKVSRMPEGRIVSATVSRTPTGRYYVSVCCVDAPAPEMLEGTVPVLGIDTGQRVLLADSEGQVAGNPRNAAKAAKRLRRAQRSLSRRQGSRKGEAKSNRWRKQARKVARIHERVADQRRDALHKATTQAVRESQAIAVEDLDVAGMRRRPRPKPDPGHPGRFLPNGAAAARARNRQGADASMGELERQLRYKCAWYGRGYVRVSRWYPSSQLCSCCGHREPSVRQGMETWVCPACGARHNRDLNAAVNIMREGARMMEGQETRTAGHAGTGDQVRQGPATLGERASGRRAGSSPAAAGRS